MTRLYTAAVDRSRIAVPYRQVRAVWDAHSITVYQAYGPAIAEPAVAPAASLRLSAAAG